MNYVTLSTLIHIAIFLFYIGIIPSWSDSYRTLKDKRIYHIFFIVLGVLVAMQSIYAPDKLDIPYVFAGFCMYALSLASEFWKKDQGFMHVLFTYTGIAIGLTLTTIWKWEMWGVWSLLIPAALLAGSSFLSLLRWNSVYWTELYCSLIILLPILFVRR